MDIEKIATQYIAVRNKKNALVKAQKAEVKLYDEAMEMAEGVLLKHLQETNSNSVACDGATVFQKEQAHVGVADWEAFINHVVEHKLWHMLNKKVSKTAALEYLEENKTLVPGTNIRREKTIQVRAK